MESKLQPNDTNGTLPIATSILNRILSLPPSCIEVSPLDPHIFLIGTYLLRPEASKAETGSSKPDLISTAENLRSGSLILGSTCKTNVQVAFSHSTPQSPADPAAKREHIQGSGSVGDLSFAPFRTYPTPYAVLDLHFSPHKPSIFAVATSTGSVEFFLLDQMKGGHVISLKSVQIADPTVLVLSLAWKPSSTTSSIIAVSLSTGQIAIFDHESLATTLRTVQAHTLEVWTVSWSIPPRTTGAAILYSGGDDSALCRHSEDLKCEYIQIDEESSDEIPYEPLSRDKKTHGAGVTAIISCSTSGSNEQELLLTGSYDEYIRVLEPALTGRRSKVLAEKRLGGGVWRLKLLSKVDSTEGYGTKMRVLASCMHAGARVLEISQSIEGIWSIDILLRFEEHQSMNYGSDGSALDKDERNLIFLSTSFYDKKLCAWNFRNPD